MWLNLDVTLQRRACLQPRSLPARPTLTAPAAVACGCLLSAASAWRPPQVTSKLPRARPCPPPLSVPPVPAPVTPWTAAAVLTAEPAQKMGMKEMKAAAMSNTAAIKEIALKINNSNHYADNK